MKTLKSQPHVLYHALECLPDVFFPQAEICLLIFAELQRHDFQHFFEAHRLQLMPENNSGSAANSVTDKTIVY